MRGILQKFIELGHGPEEGDRRRGRAGTGHPDPLDSEGCHVAQTLRESGQITHAIAVPIREAARIGLIDDGELQPGVGVVSGWAWGSRQR